MTRIFYIVPQDHDSIETPNLFNMPGNGGDQPLTIAKLRQHFPLPGLYRFRLGFRHKSRICWMDVVNEDEMLPPMENGEYVVKATRLSSRDISTPAGEPKKTTAPLIEEPASPAEPKKSVLDDSFFL